MIRYQPKNLRVAWEKVKANRGSGGVDGQSLEAVEQELDEQLHRLHEDLRTDRYQPLPVRRVDIPKAGKPGEWRPLGIPAVIDRVCQQALLNRLEPIFEPLFDDSSFGYRPGRSAKDALRKMWQEIEAGAEWIVDADLKDYFGSIDHDKLLTLVAQRVADGSLSSTPRCAQAPTHRSRSCGGASPRPMAVSGRSVFQRVRDRVAQMATTLVLEPIFEADFRSSSYGFRPKRSATQALENAARPRRARRQPRAGRGHPRLLRQHR